MTSAKQSSIRILHVVGQMNRAGAETWLMHVLRQIDRDRFQMDFLVHTTQPCAYNDEIRAFGSKIIPCLDSSKPWLYAHNFKKILREYGPYDIVHSHIHHYSGYVLRLAQQAGVPVRIAHSHIDTSPAEAKAGWHRRLYIALTKWWIARYATHGLACSCFAAANLFGLAWETDPRWQILYYGLDLTRFREIVNSVAVRAEFSIPADAFAIGHIGRFQEQKNHEFLVEIAAEVMKREPKMYLLLVGDGPLRPSIEQKVARLGLTDRVIFAGIRSDISRLMLGAMDVFLFPSRYEGTPLVLIEAQAAGLPCIFSEAIPEQEEMVKPLMRRLSLSQSASAWADAVVSARGAASAIRQSEALSIMEQSRFNIHMELTKLAALYTLGERLGVA